MWWKRHKFKVISAAAFAVILAFAFWYGGDAPNSTGWAVSPAGPKAETGALTDINPDTPSGADAPTPSNDSEFYDEASILENTPSSVAAAELAKATADMPGGDTAPDASAATGIAVDTATVPTAEISADTTLADQATGYTPASDETQAPVSETADLTCTLSVSCAVLTGSIELLDGEKKELVPESGWILEPVAVVFYEGESVFNVLRRSLKQYGVHFEFVNTPLYNAAYIEGIGNIYEFDAGGLSGWMYSVNGWFPGYSCSEYTLTGGDVVEIMYTCDLGYDIGGGYAAGGGR